MRFKRHLAGAISAIALLAAANVYAKPVTDEDIANDATSTSEVLTYGIGTQGQRFSQLDKVNTDTVAKLVPAWAYSFGGEKMRGQESQPLIQDGTIYVTGS